MTVLHFDDDVSIRSTTSNVPGKAVFILLHGKSSEYDQLTFKGAERTLKVQKEL